MLAIQIFKKTRSDSSSRQILHIMYRSPVQFFLRQMWYEYSGVSAGSAMSAQFYVAVCSCVGVADMVWALLCLFVSAFVSKLPCCWGAVGVHMWESWESWQCSQCTSKIMEIAMESKLGSDRHATYVRTI